MRRELWLSASAVLLAFVLPLLLSVSPSPRAAQAESPAAQTPAPSPAVDEPAAAVLDGSILLRVQTEDGIQEMTMADYLPGALIGEMPAAFAPEALKAQAVALRSYALYYRAAPKSAHPQADICTDAACCAAWRACEDMRESWGAQYENYLEKICTAVQATDGQYLVYDDAPILAVFHASSLGQTESGTDLGMGAPYLCSVSTPESAEAVKNLCSSVEVSAAEFQSALRTLCPEAVLETDAPETWLGECVLNEAGRVASLRIGGAEVSGLALRQLFGLRSTDFTLAWNGECFLFRVNGYGHGLGMSQHGANLMARAGSDYAEILAHYYPETRLVIAMRSGEGE